MFRVRYDSQKANRVVVVARISTDKQDEKSLEVLEALVRGWLADHYEGHSSSRTTRANSDAI